METMMLVKLGVVFLVSPLHRPNFSVNEWDRGISQGFKTCDVALSGFFTLHNNDATDMMVLFK
jgi:hypothetical protein